MQKAPPTADSDHEIPDVFTGLALAYNLQFTDIATNVTVSCLAGKAGAKVSIKVRKKLNGKFFQFCVNF